MSEPTSHWSPADAPFLVNKFANQLGLQLESAIGCPLPNRDDFFEFAERFLTMELRRRFDLTSHHPFNARESRLD